MKLKVNIILGGRPWAAFSEIPQELVPANIALKYAAVRENEEVSSVSGRSPGNGKAKKQVRYVQRGSAKKRLEQVDDLELGERLYARVGLAFVPVSRVTEADLAV